MRNYNLTIIEGNLTRDPDYKQTENGNSMLKFSIANNYGRRQEGKADSVNYFDIQAWAELAESFSSELKKGLGIRVIGRLKQWRWKDDDGKSRSKVYVIAQHIDFLFPEKTPKYF